MSVNNVGSTASAATPEQLTVAGGDIAHWAKSSDLKGGETSLYRTLANDGIASPQQNGPLTAYLHALENLKEKTLSPTEQNERATAYQDAAEAGKQAGIDAQTVSLATEAASKNRPGDTGAAGATGALPVENDATSAAAVVQKPPHQDTSAGQKTLDEYMALPRSKWFSHNLKPDERVEFGKKYYEDKNKVHDDVAAGINDPDHVKALDEDNQKYSKLNVESTIGVVSAMPRL